MTSLPVTSFPVTTVSLLRAVTSLPIKIAFADVAFGDVNSGDVTSVHNGKRVRSGGLISGYNKYDDVASDDVTTGYMLSL